MRVVAIVLVVVGLFGGIGLLSGPLFLVAWIALAVILVSATLRYRTQETRRLVAMLALAAEKGISLETTARAFADEGSGLTSSRARRMADYLAAGIPLSLALQRSRLNLSPEFLLAADMGERTGTLGMSLRKTVEQLNELDAVLRSAWEKTFYIGAIILWGLGIVVFLMVKIVPIFSQMFDEFGLALPLISQSLIAGTRFMVSYWYVVALALLPCVLLFLLGLVAYVGIPIRSLPLLRRFYSSVDVATMMRMLAVAIQHNLPLTETMYLLAGFYPLGGPRAKLAQAAGRVAQGNHWTDALQSTGLVKRSENAVFKAAERAGNLAWALNEMADSRVRRSARRFRAVSGVLFPLIIVSYALCVLFISVAVWAPITQMIQALA
jgi:type II secretory pathway component PulF